MRPISAIARQAWTSVLGSVGQGTSGRATSNELSQMNAAPIAVGGVLNWTSSPFTSRTGRVLVMGSMTVSRGAGNIAIADLVTFVLVRDLAGATAIVSAAARVGADTAGADTASYAFIAAVDAAVTVGVPHTYTIQGTIGTGGRTGVVAINEASISAIDI